MAYSEIKVKDGEKYFEYEVQDGDTLWKIAQKFLNDGNRYPEIATLNNISNPDKIYVGKIISIPIDENKKEEFSISKDEFNNALKSNEYPKQSKKYKDFMNSLDYAGITSKKEAAMYLAQLIHESGGLQKTKEDYNPVSVNEYGIYIGRGYIQLSSRANYKAAGEYLGVDYVKKPELVEEDPHAWNVSAWYWKTEVHRHVTSGFKTTTERGIRPLQPHHDSRKKFIEMYATHFT